MTELERYEKWKLQMRGSWQTQPPHRKALNEKSLMWLHFAFALGAIQRQ